MLVGQMKTALLEIMGDIILVADWLVIFAEELLEKFSPDRIFIESS